MHKATTEHQGSISQYVIGFVLSVALTLAAYFSVTGDLFEGWVMTFVLLELAIAQLFVQLFFFLHLGEEKGPRWKLVAFLFMMLVLGIVVIGSLWIMSNLDYHHGEMMSPQQKEEQVMYEEGIYR